MQSYKVNYNSSMIRNAKMLVEARGKNIEDSISKTDLTKLYRLKLSCDFQFKGSLFRPMKTKKSKRI